MTAFRPILTALYVPGDRPERFDKAVGSGADAVILDLEDAVAAGHKDRARAEAAGFLASDHERPVAVRINGFDTPWYTADLTMLAECRGLAAVRVPKVETADQIERVAELLPGIPIQAVIESALGVENLFAIATAPAAASISLGEADLRAQLAITDPAGLDWMRTRLVVAAAAAGLPPPMMSVWADLADLAGLEASCRHGKSRGFLGRAAIHPKQIPAIRAAYLPTRDELAHAQTILDGLAAAARNGSGVTVLPNGQMIDAAMRRAAQRTVALFGRQTP